MRWANKVKSLPVGIKAAIISGSLIAIGTIIGSFFDRPQPTVIQTKPQQSSPISADRNTVNGSSNVVLSGNASNANDRDIVETSVEAKNITNSTVVVGDRNTVGVGERPLK